jgi:co-chaperonin GroES (HSP10)
VAAATGIVIAVGAADARAQNLVDALVVGDGDSIAFVTDTHVSTVWVSGYADRTDVSI